MDTHLIGKIELERLIVLSRESGKGRVPHPIYNENHAGPQALINAIQPGSYMRPHMHPNRPEIWTPVKGKIILGIFDQNGGPVERFLLSRDETVYTEVPEQTYHFAFAVEPDSVFLNISQGPFNPLDSKVFPDWAPEEGSARAAEYFERVRRMFD